jgi:nucleoside-diphosphate-sugar epimerase
LPLPVARGIARFGDAFLRVTGKNFPLTSSRLEALLETTHFSCEKLLATGFRHPQSTEEGIGEMVAWYKSRSTKG